MVARSREYAAPARLGPPQPLLPVVIAVPHAGRHYPAELLAEARLPRSALETIEDRFADLLVADAVAQGALAVVARTPRACVDLNRHSREIDPAIVRGALPGGPLRASDKVAGGLGVIPSRIAAGGAVWKRALEAAEVARRIEGIHRPYHDALAAALDAAQARFGAAVLIDCHSMPPLGGTGAAQLVLGDRHGASADARVTDAAARAAAAHGLRLARNRPYAGGFTLERHGAPAQGRHAVQLEIDRALYLDAALLTPGPGLAEARRLVADVVRAVAQAVDVGRPTALAAE